VSTTSTYDLNRLILQAKEPGTHFSTNAIFFIEERLKRAVLALQGDEEHGVTPLIKDNDSFGLVICNLGYSTNFRMAWDRPDILLEGSIVIGWGPESPKYIANGLRKCRATARTGIDTIELNPSGFVDAVPSVSNDPFRPFTWGDFPHGGARFVGLGDKQLLVGVSSLDADEDHLIAGLAGDLLHMFMRRQWI
jgi:hypothetical protein